MATKKTETTKAAKPRAKKATEPKAAKEPKAKREPKPKEELVVFAFRLSQVERDLIHKTAGPRNATQFVRRVATAFAHEDETAFKTVIKEAREARG